MGAQKQKEVIKIEKQLELHLPDPNQMSFAFDGDKPKDMEKKTPTKVSWSICIGNCNICRLCDDNMKGR